MWLCFESMLAFQMQSCMNLFVCLQYRNILQIFFAEQTFDDYRVWRWDYFLVDLLRALSLTEKGGDFSNCEVSNYEAPVTSTVG